MEKRNKEKTFLWILIFVIGIFIAFNVGKASISSGVYHDMQSLETTSGSGTSVDSDSDGIIDKAEALDDSGSAKDYDDIISDARVGNCVRVLAYRDTNTYYDHTGTSQPYSSNKAKTKVPERCINKMCRIITIDGNGDFHRYFDYMQMNDSAMITRNGDGSWIASGGNRYVNGDGTNTMIISIPGTGRQLNDDSGAESDWDKWGTNDKLLLDSEVWVCG